MTREQQIKRAATANSNSLSKAISFVRGAQWADEHPNIENLWHNASEEPRYEEFLLAEESSEFNVYKLSGQEDNNSWELLVSAMGIIRWAYISDLLPKQFGNSEQLKGDER